MDNPAPESVLRAALAYAQAQGIPVEGYSVTTCLDQGTWAVSFARKGGPPGDHFLVLVDAQELKALRLIPGR
jgi:hypothetical protein